MSCACKVNKDISKLNKRFGLGRDKGQTNIRERVGLFLKSLFMYIIIIPFIPIIIIDILYKLVFSKNKRIKVFDFFLFKPHKIR